MEINEIFRRARPYSEEPNIIDGYRNFFSATLHPGKPKIAMDSGIYKPETTLSYEPVIFISSSPHKYGSETTPWQDIIRPEIGHIKYYGDNKIDKKGQAKDPSLAKGNKYLLEQFKLQSSNLETDRQKAAPILCFKSEEINGKKKGFISFQGVCLIEKVELVTQIDPATNKPFSNYCFDLIVITLKHENEIFNYNWINERRSNKDPALTINQAPKAWQDWIKKGKTSLSSIRRNVLEKFTVKNHEQIPNKGTIEEKIRNEIYQYYGGKKISKEKNRFEYLAAIIAERVINQNGGNYKFGWITQGGADNAIDFVGRLDVGDGFAKTKLIVLGQAKCVDPNVPTNGQHIARTVARLKRGWLAVFVTTSYFSEPVQLEILEDNYPIILIHGLRLASEFKTMMFEKGKKIYLSLLNKSTQNMRIMFLNANLKRYFTAK